MNWVTNGAPENFWLSGFFFTLSFFTGVKQNYSRFNKLPIDSLDFDFEVIPDDSDAYDTSKKPESGCYIYGLFLEGCRFDQD